MTNVKKTLYMAKTAGELLKNGDLGTPVFNACLITC